MCRSEDDGAAAAPSELTIHPIREDDNVLAQLLAAVERIESGLGTIYELIVKVDDSVKAKADGSR